MATTIDELLVEMDRRLERAVQRNDQRGHFAAVYRAVTARVRDGIEAGEFDDGERMERFDVAFASLYLDAEDAYDAGQRVPSSWRVAFEHSDAPLLVLQHVLLGMNAHINLDLGVAAAQTAGPAIADLREDFERLNDVLAAMIDRMQEAIATVSPWTGAVDRLGGRADEMISEWSVTEARRGAWRFALELSVASSPDALVAVRDRRIAAIGLAIARPVWWLRLLVRIARLRESSDVGAVVDALRRTGASVPTV